MELPRTVAVLAKNEERTVGQILSALTPKLDEMQQNWGSSYSYSLGGGSFEAIYYLTFIARWWLRKLFFA